MRNLNIWFKSDYQETNLMCLIFSYYILCLQSCFDPRYGCVPSILNTNFTEYSGWIDDISLPCLSACVCSCALSTNRMTLLSSVGSGLVACSGTSGAWPTEDSFFTWSGACKHTVGLNDIWVTFDFAGHLLVLRVLYSRICYTLFRSIRWPKRHTHIHSTLMHSTLMHSTQTHTQTHKLTWTDRQIERQTLSHSISLHLPLSLPPSISPLSNKIQRTFLAWVSKVKLPNNKKCINRNKSKNVCLLKSTWPSTILEYKKISLWWIVWK